MFPPESVDDVLLVFMLVAPLYIVLRFNRWGIVIGGGFSWFLGILAGMLLVSVRGDNLADAVWIIFGLPFCLFYSALIYISKKLYLWMWHRSS